MKVVLALGAVAALAGCNAFDGGRSEAVEICETHIKDHLRSPSTYERISTTTAESEPKAGYAIIYVTSDAANAFGTPVRSTDACIFEFDPATGKFPDRYAMEAGEAAAGADKLEWIADPEQHPKPAFDCCLGRDKVADALGGISGAAKPK